MCHVAASLPPYTEGLTDTVKASSLNTVTFIYPLPL
jgi:hypothetical protein